MRIRGIVRTALVLAFLTNAPTAQAVCVGDCNDSGDVKVDELVTSVNIALLVAPLSRCLAIETNTDGQATVNELITAVNNALRGCRAVPTPTPDLGNQAPQVNAGDDVITAIDQPPTLIGSATDDGMPIPPGALTLLWTKVSGPGSIVFGAATAATTSATFSQVGSYIVRLTANDGARTTSDDVAVHIDLSAVNLAPELEAVGDQVISPGTALSLGLVGRDGNPFDALTYSLVSGPQGASVGADGIFNFTPLAAQLGAHVVIARVQDQDGLMAETSFDVMVVAGNQPPAFDPLADVTTPLGVLYTTTLTATDPDASDTLSFTLLSAPPGMTLTGAQLSWTPAPDQFGTHVVSVEVSDGRGGDSRGDLRILVPSPAAPTAQDDAYQVVLGRTLTVPAAGVLANDASVDGSPLTAQQLTQPDKGSVTAFGADGSFTYTAPPALPPPPPLDVALKYAVDLGNSVYYGPYPPLVADLDGDTKPEIIFWEGDRLYAVHGGSGELLFTAISLPEPHTRCAMYGRGNDTFAAADIDDDGAVEIVMSAQCAADNFDYTFVVGRATRIIALAYDAAAPSKFRVKWLSDPLSPQVPVPPELFGDGHLWVPFGGVPAYTSFTIARLRAAEKPTVLLGRTYSGSEGGLSHCGWVLPGKTDPHCRFVFALDGETGAVKTPYYATPEDPAAVGAYHHLAFNAPASPIVADVDADGALELLYQGTLWNIDGTIKRQFDGTAATAPSTSDSIVVDVDGDAEMEIVAMDNGNSGRAGVLRAWKADGRLLWVLHFPGDIPVTRITAADIDRSGRPTILFAIRDTLWAVDHQGHVKWFRRFPHDDRGYHSLVNGNGVEFAVADLNGDGIVEVIVQYTKSTILFLRGDTGETQTSWTYPGGANEVSSSAQAPLIADLDGTGEASLIWYHDVNLNSHSYLQVLKGASAPWRTAATHFNQRAYWETNFNPDGSVPVTYPRHTAEPRTNIFRQQPPVPYALEPRLRTQARFTYAAQDGPLASAPATVTIDILPENRPPVVTSLPPPTSPSADYRFVPYTFQITGVDPDPGDVVAYELIYSSCSDPFRVTISPTGLFRYVDRTPNEDLCYFQVRLTDGNGGVTDQPFSMFFTLQTRLVPSVVGLDRSAALMALATRELVLGRLTEVPDNAPAGTVLLQNPPGETSAPRRSPVDLTLSLGPGPLGTDDDGDGFTENEGDCDDGNAAFNPGLPEVPSNGVDENCDGSERVVREVVVEPRSALRVTGEQVAFSATAVYLDGTSADVAPNWFAAAPTIASIDSAGVARALNIGATAISATFGGAVGRATFTVGDRAAGDQDEPTAVITAPANGGAITGLTQITGTASDANFLRYELAVAPAGTDAFATIGTGDAAIVDGVLGTVDATVLANDIYVLRLSVFDANENVTRAEVEILVEGSQKVGNFTLAFIDLTIPVAGLPIEVVRGYDSRDTRPGDFGIGWTLQLRSVRLSTNRILGTGWQVVKPGLTFALIPTADHFASVILPDGRVERFELVITPSSSILVPLSSIRARFVPRPGTLGTLESLDNNDLLIADAQPGEVELLDDTTLASYEPRRFRYTTVDGVRIELNRVTGSQTITDTNGNSLTVGPGGIAHSSGTQVTFTRDAQQRITQIVDPMGHARSYAYDARGDLVSHTDPSDNTTRYTYNRAHGLLQILDPLGRAVARNEYDDDGRLVATVDGQGRRTTFTHDVNGRETIVTDTNGATRRLAYDERGNVTVDARTVTGEGGPVTASTAFTYDADGNVLSTTDADGLQTASTYSGSLLLADVVDPEGLALRTSYAYDDNGDVVAATDPAGRTFTLSYDANRNVTEVRTPLDGTSATEVDGSGQPVRVVDALGTATILTRDASGRVVREEVVDAASTLLRRRELTYDANGNQLTQTLRRTSDGVPTAITTSMTYDASNRLVSITNPAGGLTTIEYDALNSEVGRVDTLGRRTSFAYDTSGRLTTTTYADGTSDSSTYDGEGRVLSTVNRAGRTTTFDYDELGRLVRTTRADGSATQTVYSAGGQVIASIDARGNRTEYGYDTAGRRVGTTLPAVQDGALNAPGRPTLSQELDTGGRPMAMIDPLGHRTTIGYDSGSRPTRITFPDGSVATREFDALGRLATMTNEDGQTITYRYDGLGRLVEMSGLLGSSRYTYDEAGNLLTQTDALGRVTRFRYDVLGRLIEKQYPGGEREQLAYDAAGNVVARTDANGRTTTFEHDPLNRLTQKVLPDSTSVRYELTATDQRARVIDARGTTAYIYDALDRLLRVTSPSGETLRYTRDPDGNLLSLAGPSSTVSFSYDAMNRLVGVTAPEGQSAYTYDLAGNRLRLTAANGLVAEYAYDVRDRPTQIAHRSGSTILQSFASTYSPAGRRTSLTEADGSTELYAYDAQGRLVSETRTGTNPFSRTHTYDAVGNRTQIVRDSVPTAFTYDVDDRLLGDGTATYAHDANGNQISRTVGGSTTAYAYDPEDRLTRIDDASGLIQFTYDADGNRIETDSPAGTTRFLVDTQNVTGLSQVVEERDGGGALLARYTYGKDRLAMVRGGTASMYHHDAHGSARLLSSSGGAVTDTYAYDGYGATVAATGSTDNPYRYAGERLEAASGHYHLRARDYDPALGRFTSRDPFGGRLQSPQSLHRYLYANADPVNGIDPTGLNTLPELAVSQFINNIVSFGELFTKVRALCKAETTIEQVSELLFYTNIAAQILTLTGVSILPAQATNVGPFTKVTSGVKTEIPLIDVKRAKKISGRLERFTFSLAAGGGLKGGVKFGFEITDNPNVDIDATWPPLKVSVSVGLKVEIPLAEFTDCGITVGKVALSQGAKLAGGGTAGQGGNAGAAIAIDLKLSLFQDRFKATVPLIGIEGDAVQGKVTAVIAGFAVGLN